MNIREKRAKSTQNRIRPIQEIKRKLADLDFAERRFEQNNDAFHLIIQFGDTFNDWHNVVIAGALVE